MKSKLSLLLFFATTLFTLKVSAINGQLDEKNSYVVIGAFSSPKNAIEFTEKAKMNNLAAQFSMNPLRNLFYVFVLHTGDRKVAIEEAKRLRNGSAYSDTWVFTGLLGENETAKGNDLNPITGEKIIKIEAQDKDQSAALHVSTSNLTPSITEAPVKSLEEEKVVQIEDPVTKATSIEEAEPGSKRFLFKIFTNIGAVETQGDVDIMDLDKTKPRKMASYRGNEPVNIKPINKSGNVAFVCEVFGYHKITTPINFNEPQATEWIKIDGDKTIVPFELVRLKKGDYAVMYNVYFYKDAGIMRPESKFEVNSLLDMMKENPKYRIRIHGHTNGNSHGKVISMGESKNFFAITTDVKQGFGSAKKLSEERAKVIQGYLIKEGIDPARLEIKAWGGNRPIYEKDHTLAQSNVRVEIEILED